MGLAAQHAFAMVLECLGGADGPDHFLPIPLGNLFPAVSLLMFGLGLLTRDGLMLVLSLLLGLAGLSALVAAAGWLWRVVASTWPF